MINFSYFVIRMSSKNYVFYETLGEGTFGVTKRAVRKSDNKIVVIKLYKNTTTQAIQDFNVEIKNLQAVSNECSKYTVCLVGTYQPVGQPPRIIMDFIDGYTLTKGLQTISYEERNESDVMMSQLVEGLHHMHSMNVTHQDIKGDNIMYDTQAKRWKYVDWGLACLRSMCQTSCQRRHDWPCGTQGTEYTAPPEIMLNLDGYRSFEDLKAHDVWSLGVVFLRWYSIDSSSFTDLLNKKKWDEAFPRYWKDKTIVILSMNRVTNTSAKHIIPRFLEKNPETRLANFNEIFRHVIPDDVFMDDWEKKGVMWCGDVVIIKAVELLKHQKLQDRMNELNREYCFENYDNLMCEGQCVIALYAPSQKKVDDLNDIVSSRIEGFIFADDNGFNDPCQSDVCVMDMGILKAINCMVKLNVLHNPIKYIAFTDPLWSQKLDLFTMAGFAPSSTEDYSIILKYDKDSVGKQNELYNRAEEIRLRNTEYPATVIKIPPAVYGESMKYTRGVYGVDGNDTVNEVVPGRNDQVTFSTHGQTVFLPGVDEFVDLIKRASKGNAVHYYVDLNGMWSFQVHPSVKERICGHDPSYLINFVREMDGLNIGKYLKGADALLLRADDRSIRALYNAYFKLIKQLYFERFQDLGPAFEGEETLFIVARKDKREFVGVWKDVVQQPEECQS